VSSFDSGLGILFGGLAFDSAGDLFSEVTVAPSTVLYKYTSGGSRSIFAPASPRFVGLGTDSSGDLFGAAGIQGIYEYTPGGALSLAVAPIGVGADFNDVAIQTPEPSSLAVTLVGLFAFGVFRRSHRRARSMPCGGR
jgi:hypothetical protein